MLTMPPWHKPSPFSPIARGFDQTPCGTTNGLGCWSQRNGAPPATGFTTTPAPSDSGSSGGCSRWVYAWPKSRSCWRSGIEGLVPVATPRFSSTVGSQSSMSRFSASNPCDISSLTSSAVTPSAWTAVVSSGLAQSVSREKVSYEGVSEMRLSLWLHSLLLLRRAKDGTTPSRQGLGPLALRRGRSGGQRNAGKSDPAAHQPVRSGGKTAQSHIWLDDQFS